MQVTRCLSHGHWHNSNNDGKPEARGPGLGSCGTGTATHAARERTMDTHRGPLPGALAKPAAPAAQQQSRPSRCAPFFILSDVVIGAMHSILSMRFGRITGRTCIPHFPPGPTGGAGVFWIYRRFFTAIPAECQVLQGRRAQKDGREGLLRSPGRREAGPAGRAAVRARVIV